MINVLQQIWFPITAMLTVLVLVLFALNHRSRQRRRAAVHSQPIVVAPVETRRDEDR
ncbi:hypothetical protein [Asticcacaulis sp. AC402]|uniref:hypothetical protein n=1 Tax=Asticcacaulis sp. AC402 TaxID=1282361 RepID=UPI0003C3D13E|nr:hypothetical protein [Asticcacaulis sp. AC402]ESQ75388.1 hypothetical protein ABAC402_09810 [Asticcacaulis sp. AC402]